MTFRADAPVSGGMIAAEVRATPPNGDERVTRDVSVAAAVQPVANPAATTPEKLAYTGASPVVGLVLGGALVAAGAGALLFLRRRRANI
jgi:LPXTG-motif cell wall-anchored protein